MQGVHQDFANWKVKSPAIPRPHRGGGFKWLVHYRSWTGLVLFSHWLLVITYPYTYGQDISIPNSIHEVAGMNPAGGGLQLMPVRRIIAQDLSLSFFHRLYMT